MVITRPPMGMNTWNYFGPNINEKLLFELADAMVEKGLIELGYNYLVIDDCWAEFERDENGILVPNKEKFPNGMKVICDYLHERGLKFGMYSCLGTMTCASYPGSFGHEYTDANTFAEWGIDFLKYDYCFRSKQANPDDLYRKMSIALKSTGREILFSACSWGRDKTEDWIDTTGANIWRLAGDIKDDWDHIKCQALTYHKYNGVSFMNCFSDLDMLIVGMNGEGYCAIPGAKPTIEEYKTHFGFWCLVGSPLMIGSDIRNIDDESLALLSNKDLIALNQDKAFNRPWLIQCSDEIIDSPEICCYGRILDNGDIAVGFFNFSEKTVYNRYVTFDMLGLNSDLPLDITIKDLFTGKNVEFKNEMLNHYCLEPHQSAIYRISIKQK